MIGLNNDLKMFFVTTLIVRVSVRKNNEQTREKREREREREQKNKKDSCKKELARV